MKDAFGGELLERSSPSDLVSSASNMTTRRMFPLGSGSATNKLRHFHGSVLRSTMRRDRKRIRTEFPRDCRYLKTNNVMRLPYIPAAKA